MSDVAVLARCFLTVLLLILGLGGIGAMFHGMDKLVDKWVSALGDPTAICVISVFVIILVSFGMLTVYGIYAVWAY
jgi:hypothetical protein